MKTVHLYLSPRVQPDYAHVHVEVVMWVDGKPFEMNIGVETGQVEKLVRSGRILLHVQLLEKGEAKFGQRLQRCDVVRG